MVKYSYSTEEENQIAQRLTHIMSKNNYNIALKYKNSFPTRGANINILEQLTKHL